MSGWGIGGFDLSAINEIGSKLQQFKDEVEQSIEASILGEQEPSSTDGDGERKGTFL